MDRIPRFFVNSKDINSKIVRITDEQVLHILKSLRLSVGDEIIIFDGESKKFRANLSQVTKRQVEIEKIESLPINDSETKITLVQGIPKAKKMDMIVKRLTEIGISEIIPIETDYSVLKAKDIKKKYARWKKITIEACKQSERDVFLKIHEPISFSDLETVGEYDLKLIASTKEDPQDLKDVLKKNSAKSIIYMVGPEGGFTPNEIVQAQENGFTQIRFGSNIMRSETAAIFLGSVIKYELG